MWEHKKAPGSKVKFHRVCDPNMTILEMLYIAETYLTGLSILSTHIMFTDNPDSPPFFTSQSPPGYFSAAMEEVEYGRNASLLHGGSDSAPSLWSDAMRRGPSPTALQDTAALTGESDSTSIFTESSNIVPAFSAEDHHAHSSSSPLPSTGATSSWPQVHGDFSMVLDNGAAALESKSDMSLFSKFNNAIPSAR